MVIARFALVLALAAHGLAFASGCGHGGAPGGTAPAIDGATPITESRYVRIGGIDQWITIRGKRRDNPILLVLHGGPGNAWSPFADQVFGAGWTERFTVVQWDQRGAGRTFGKTGPSIASTMTMERMVQDGIEVTRFLEHELQQPRIVLTGGSWGSVLGVLMVKARPELYCAYVGVAQVVNMQELLVASYQHTMQAARAAGNTTAIDELTAVGPPPWNTLRAAVTPLRWARMLEPQDNQAFEVELSPGYGSPKERADRQAAGDMSATQLVGPTAEGPLMQVDLPALGTRFEIPVVLIQGSKDLRTVPELTRAYFDRIEAPYKQLFVDPETGHEPTRSSLQLWLKVLDETIRPRCPGRAS